MAKIKCTQCNPMVINGVFCHESGCPNEYKIWDEQEEDWLDYEPDEDDFFSEDEDEERGFWENNGQDILNPKD